jgi:hypothetical protein
MQTKINPENRYQESIILHYQNSWNAGEPAMFLYDKGPFNKLPYDFRVLEFEPRKARNMWTYATCCMSQPEDDVPIEMHIFSLNQDRTIVELLTAIAYYHRNTKRVGLNHSINLGRPWKNNSTCSYGLISLPYLDGPKLENFLSPENNQVIKFYWVIPITEKEYLYKRSYGVEALEQKFGKDFNYLNPLRQSVM